MNDPDKNTDYVTSKDLTEFKLEMVQRLTIVETTLKTYLGGTGVIGLLLILMQVYSVIKAS